MAQLGKLIIENNKLKRQLSQYQQILGKSPFIDDSVLKGGYRVVKNIEERDNIDCCHRKLGMKVLVIGDDLSFKEYILKTDNCKENIWEEVDVTVTIEENEVFLIEDYSELSENLTTQKELNLILKQLILNLQTQIDNIELIDEKVQITEDTPFANIGQSQKDFNKNISDKFNEKLDKGSLTSNDDSLLVEGENIEVQLSIYSEEFEQKIFNLTFTPINILGVYINGIYLRTSEFILNLPKSITINDYNTNDVVIVQYQHLKKDI